MLYALSGRNELLNDSMRLKKEAEFVYNTLVLPSWTKEFHGLPDVLYGYIMGVMARIDLSSTIWFYDRDRDQTKNMVDFLSEIGGLNREVANFLVIMWRHKLMHTSSPREFFIDSGLCYSWNLHWHDQIPHEQIFKFIETPDKKICNVTLFALIDVMISTIQKAIESPKFMNNLIIYQTKCLDSRIKFK